jgi:hypothetical protein
MPGKAEKINFSMEEMKWKPWNRGVGGLEGGLVAAFTAKTVTPTILGIWIQVSWLCVTYTEYQLTMTDAQSRRELNSSVLYMASCWMRLFQGLAMLGDVAL